MVCYTETKQDSFFAASCLGTFVAYCGWYWRWKNGAGSESYRGERRYIKVTITHYSVLFYSFWVVCASWYTEDSFFAASCLGNFVPCRDWYWCWKNGAGFESFSGEQKYRRFQKSLYMTIGLRYSEFAVINIWVLCKGIYIGLCRIKFSMEWYTNWLWNHVYMFWKWMILFTLLNDFKYQNSLYGWVPMYYKSLDDQAETYRSDY
jgi:hypothetical protein